MLNWTRYPKTTEELQREGVCPAVFAYEKHVERSDGYKHITTADIIRPMERRGYAISAYASTRSRDPANLSYARHIVRLRRKDQWTADTATPEIIIMNGGDGRTAFKLFQGFCRFACLNGIIVMSGEHSAFTVYHSAAHAVDEAALAMYELAVKHDEAEDTMRRMRDIFLPPDVQRHIAVEAMKLRGVNPVAEDEDYASTYNRIFNVCVGSNLRPTRREDSLGSLDCIYNMLQE